MTATPTPTGYVVIELHAANGNVLRRASTSSKPFEITSATHLYERARDAAEAREDEP